MSLDADVLIVGGGPAGLATAAYAGRRGLKALVLERRGPAPDKACGEGILPAGVACLAELGVGNIGRPFAGIRLRDGDRCVSADFREGPGLAVARPELAEALEAAALAAGAALWHRCALRSWREEAGGVGAETEAGALRARFLVGADGLHSAVRGRLGPAPIPEPRRYGVRRRFRAEAPDRVEVLFSEDCEAYLTPLAPDRLGVALLGPPGRFEELLPRFPDLARRLADAEPEGPALGAGPLHRPAALRARGAVALVGDAAGFVDALTGEGLSLAFRCARILADTLAAGRPLADYGRAAGVLHGRYARAARAWLWATRDPRRRAALLEALDPMRFARLLELGGGRPPGLGDLGLLARLAWVSGSPPRAR